MLNPSWATSRLPSARPKRFATVGAGIVAALLIPVTALGVGTVSAASDQGWLHADGPVLRDVNNKLVTLHGAETTGAVSAQTVSYLQAAGMNEVRYTEVWENFEREKPTLNADGSLTHHYNDSELATMDREIKLLTDAHIRVIIDFHQSKWSTAFDNQAHGLPKWMYSSATADSATAKVDFFLNRPDPRLNLGNWKPQELTIGAQKVLVNRYKNNSYVVGLDLLNEPGWDSNVDGNGAAQVNGDDLVRFYRKSVAALQPINDKLLWIYENGIMAAVSKDRPFIQGVEQKLDVPNAVFSFHYYPWRGSGNKDESVARQFNVLKEQASLAQDTLNQPFYIGEFRAYNQGYDSAENQTFGADWERYTLQLMAFTKAKNISWNFWALQKGAGANLLAGTKEAPQHGLKMDIVNVLKTSYGNVTPPPTVTTPSTTPPTTGTTRPPVTTPPTVPVTVPGTLVPQPYPTKCLPFWNRIHLGKLSADDTKSITSLRIECPLSASPYATASGSSGVKVVK